MPVFKEYTKLKPLKVFYRQSVGISPQDVGRRIECAFNILFEEIAKLQKIKNEHEYTGTPNSK